VVTDEVLDALLALNELAPLHNPPAVAALRLARSALPAIPHVAVFDTSFHATLPPHAYEYALPAAVRQRFGIRRYGFHGISHAHVMESVAAYLHQHASGLRIISCHLGNGASVAAIEYGRSVDTSMGMTPLEGLVMGTRSGDVDPGAVLHLLRSGAYDVERLDSLLNHESGLKGLAGTNDLREIERRAAAGDEACELAIDIYAHRVRKYIGAYAAAMGGVDVIAFTGGVGEHSVLMRNRILQRLEFLGARLDRVKNSAATVSEQRTVESVATDAATVAIFVVKADEEVEMTRAAAAILTG
jgi:acetate kinase